MKKTMASPNDHGNDKIFDAITLDAMRDTAQKAAYCTIRMLYLGQVRRVKNAQGETIAHDGTSGADAMITRVFNAFRACMTSAVARIERAEAAHEDAPALETLDVLESAVKQGLRVCASDADDCISVAFEALYADFTENDGACSPEAFSKACSAVHAYVYSEESATATRTRRKYDESGNLLALNEYKYVKHPHMYIEDEATGDIVDVNDGISRLMRGLVAHETIQAVLALLTPTQKRIIAHVAKGHTNATIAKRLNITPVTVRRHLQIIREKALPMMNA